MTTTMTCPHCAGSGDEGIARTLTSATPVPSFETCVLCDSAGFITTPDPLGNHLLLPGEPIIRAGRLNCKMTLCHDAATARCRRCESPICPRHTAAGEGRGIHSLCRSCKLDDWRASQAVNA